MSSHINETTIRVIAAAIVLSIGALATGYAQSKIGSSSAGMLAERPENFGQALILTALPETVLVLAFVMSILILLGIGG